MRKLFQRLSWLHPLAGGAAIVILLLTFPLAAFAQEPPPLAAAIPAVSVSPATLSVERGQEFTVEIVLNTADNQVNAVDLHLSFETTYLEGLSCTPGTALSGVSANPGPNNTDGTIDLGVRKDGGGFVSGTLILCTLAFRAKQATSATLLTSRGTPLVVAPGGIALGSTWSNGSVTVTEPWVQLPPTLRVRNFGRSAAGGGWSSYNTYPRAVGDVNGDGRADVVGFGSLGTWVSLTDGDHLDAPSLWVNNYGQSPAGGGWTNFDTFPRLLGDVNGDGLDDVVGFGIAGTFVSLSTGSRFEAPTLWSRNFGQSAAAGGWTSFSKFPRAVADVNGDGRADLIGFGLLGTFVSLSTGSAFQAPTSWINNFGQLPAGGGWTSVDTYPRVVADVSGDGRADIVGFGIAGTWVALSTGTRFAPPALWLNNLGASAAGGGWVSQDTYPRTVGDINGDGKGDLVGFGEAGVLVALSTGSSLAPIKLWVKNFGHGAAAGGWTSFDFYPRLLGDITGDGRSEIIGFGEAGTWVANGGRF